MNLLSLISSWLDIIYQITTKCATVSKPTNFHQLNMTLEPPCEFILEEKNSFIKLNPKFYGFYRKIPQYIHITIIHAICIPHILKYLAKRTWIQRVQKAINQSLFRFCRRVKVAICKQKEFGVAGLQFELLCSRYWSSKFTFFFRVSML